MDASDNEEDEVINRFLDSDEQGFSFLKSIYNDDEKSDFNSVRGSAQKERLELQIQRRLNNEILNKN